MANAGLRELINATARRQAIAEMLQRRCLGDVILAYRQRQITFDEVRETLRVHVPRSVAWSGNRRLDGFAEALADAVRPLDGA